MDVIKHIKRAINEQKENFYVYMYKEVLAFIDWFMSVRFMVTAALLAARRIRILLMNQLACGR
jgi:hypothetical protein